MVAPGVAIVEQYGPPLGPTEAANAGMDGLSGDDLSGSGSRGGQRGDGWFIRRRFGRFCSAEAANAGLDGSSIADLSGSDAPAPPLRAWMRHPSPWWRNVAARLRHCGPGCAILRRGGGMWRPSSAIAGLDAPSIAVVAERGGPAPSWRGRMRHPSPWWRRVYSGAGSSSEGATGSPGMGWTGCASTGVTCRCPGARIPPGMGSG